MFLDGDMTYEVNVHTWYIASDIYGKSADYDLSFKAIAVTGLTNEDLLFKERQL